MSPQRRRAFTLVEMLVVVVIIGLLAALLMPAINSARLAARRAKCQNNQSEIFKAIAQYEAAKQHLPGYVNMLGESADPVNAGKYPLCWPVVILSQLGRDDVWKTWQGAVSGSIAPGVVSIPQYVCPDADQRTYGLSYVANCGLPDRPVRAAGGKDGPNQALFLNRYCVAGQASVMTSGIRDGATQTLLVSENLSAGIWTGQASSGNLNLTNAAGMLGSSDLLDSEFFERWVGMLWHTRGSIEGNDFGGYASKYDEETNECYKFNHCPERTEDADWRFARPSSNHPGGAIVTFADGHQDFQSDEIDYNVYRRMMAPSDSYAGVDPSP